MSSVKELFDLSGQVAVVTGGATGIGLQMAKGLAERGVVRLLRDVLVSPA